jgi:hypothetical protein
VVPESADNTTNFFPGEDKTKSATFFIRSALPTEVPPNFKTTMIQ